MEQTVQLSGAVRGIVTTYVDPSMSHGIGHIFPKVWTDEQAREWNIANCQCPFHASLRERAA